MYAKTLIGKELETHKIRCTKLSFPSDGSGRMVGLWFYGDRYLGRKSTHMYMPIVPRTLLDSRSLYCKPLFG
jgi:hypothetical protein